MLIMAGFIVLCLGMVLIVEGEKIKAKTTDTELYKYQIGGIVMVVAMAVFFIVWPINYLGSITEVAEMEAFYNANRQNYETIVEQTSRAVVFLENESLLQISVENLKQSTNWSERLKELRDKAFKYNNSFHRITAYNENLLLDWFYKDLPETLKPIVLELRE